MNKKLSICITLKNRTQVYTEHGNIFPFVKCIESINNSIRDKDNTEIIISDWKSTDYPILDWIGDKIPDIFKHVITIDSPYFSAGVGRNIAAKYSSGEILFFLDADIIINEQVINYALSNVNINNVYYPTVKYQTMYKGNYITHEGGGNLFINKDTFNKTNKWPEYWEHGFEDIDFHRNIEKLNINILTEDIDIYHPWHPQDKKWKNQFSKKDKNVNSRKEFYTIEAEKEIEKFSRDLNKYIYNNNTTHQYLKKSGEI